MEETGVDLAAATALLVNWNQADLTIRAAQALINDGLPPGRIVVVDNGSADDSWLRFRDVLSTSHLVRVEKNVGYARGANIGAGIVAGDYLLLVNNDAFVHRPGSVARLLAALERDGVGIAVPRVRNEDLSLQPNVVPFLRPLVALVRASGLSRFLPNRMQPRWATHWDHSRSRRIDAANGAVMAIRGDVWEQLGGLRESAFMYAEDIDLFWRIRALGWDAWFEADAEFVHLGNTSNRTVWNLAQRAEVIGSAERSMLADHLSPAAWRFVIAITRLGHLVRFAAQRLAGNADGAAVSEASFRGLGGHANPHAIEAPSSNPRIEIVAPGVEHAT